MITDPRSPHHICYTVARTVIAQKMKSRQIRKKEDSDSDVDEIAAATSRAQLAAKKAVQNKRIAGNNTLLAAKSKPTLSFEETADGDDQGSESLVMKKSKASREMTKTKLAVPLPDVDSFQREVRQSSGAYDAESLAALRSAQRYAVGAAQATKV